LGSSNMILERALISFYPGYCAGTGYSSQLKDNVKSAELNPPFQNATIFKCYQVIRPPAIVLHDIMQS